MAFKIIYTLGTSYREIKEFIEILKKYLIESVIDLRRWPTSKYLHFKKENLEKILNQENIFYFHLKELGGYRKGGYQKFTKTEEFKKGFKKLLKIAKKKRSVIICAEKFPFKCHRRFISQKLKERGFKIIHLIDKEKIW